MPRASITVPNVVQLVPRPTGQVSLVLPVSTSCKACGAIVRDELPLVLDEVERPDLWARALDGSLARFTCLNGHENPDDNVSFVLRDRLGQLAFSPAEVVDRDQWREVAAALLGALPGSLITTDPVLLRTIPRSALHNSLSEQAAAEAAEARSESPATAAPSPASEVDEAERDALWAIVTQAQDLAGRYEQTRQPDVLDAAIVAWNAVVRHPAFHSAPAELRAAFLQNSGTARLWRTERPFGSRPDPAARGDLDAAVRDLRQSLELQAPDRRQGSRNGLIVALTTRYDRLQNLTDLDDLIRLLRDESQDASLEVRDLVRARSDLSNRLWDRFGSRRDIADIDEAMAQIREALVFAEESSRHNYQMTLGMYLIERSGAQPSGGQRGDLDEALRLINDAAPHADSAEDWNLVGSVRQRAFNVMESADMLDGAVDAFARAVELSVGDRSNSGLLGNLGNAHLQRWQLSHDVLDLNAAVGAYEKALTLEETLNPYLMAVVGAPASPLLAPALVNLARALSIRASECNDDADRLRADQLLDRVAEAIEATDPETAFFAAWQWGQAEFKEQHWSQGSAAFALAQDAVDQLYRVQITRRFQEAQLRLSGDVGGWAALALARDHRPAEAAVAYERSRARMLSDALERDRLDLDRLEAAGRPDLVERYERAAGTMVGMTATR